MNDFPAGWSWEPFRARGRGSFTSPAAISFSRVSWRRDHIQGGGRRLRPGGLAQRGQQPLHQNEPRTLGLPKADELVGVWPPFQRASRSRALAGLEMVKDCLQNRLSVIQHWFQVARISFAAPCHPPPPPRPPKKEDKNVAPSKKMHRSPQKNWNQLSWPERVRRSEDGLATLSMCLAQATRRSKYPRHDLRPSGWGAEKYTVVDAGHMAGIARGSSG